MLIWGYGRESIWAENTAHAKALRLELDWRQEEIRGKSSGKRGQRQERRKEGQFTTGLASIWYLNREVT